MASYDKARDALDELEQIENAISSRFKRNPELFYRTTDSWKAMKMPWDFPSISEADKAANKVFSVSKPRRNRKQVSAQEHEINMFLEEYQKNCSLLTTLKFEDSEKYKIPDGSVDKLLRDIDDIEKRFANRSLEDGLVDEYGMFSSSTAEIKNLLSLKAQNLDINTVFARDELYGDVLDLGLFHQRWLGVVKNSECTFLQFIAEMEKYKDFTFLLRPAVDRSSARYREFVVLLLTYVEGFAKRTYPLLDWDAIDTKLSIDFGEFLVKPIPGDQEGTIFCVPCYKHFKVETVYRSHLSGKKHLTNLTKNKDFLAREHKLHELFTFLAREVSHTREFIERKLAFTSEERAQEMERLSQVYDAPLLGPHEPEEDVDHSQDRSVQRETELGAGESIDLPLGPDGFPMPYWLYKLQGLDIEYRCEICGNHVYKGRRQFEKHFSELRHNLGLRKLGIESSSVFQGVTSIVESQKLAAHLKERSTVSAQPGTTKLDVEVEDDEGNVMSMQVYQELKKQGLL
ncbi:LADA_0B08174g1_1 [Lachancea dasiensis]|uniref:LADA_0B08174g1_1 n=1 Tax=Lachancea dasiensis TaxID=1072105 RepID=A0A1G4IU42_9SACH|nr:LADA_0B08174g1_1 [Lachancea dasiensis]